MIGEVLTDDESEVKEIVDGLSDQADHLENKARFAQEQERNLGFLAIVSGAGLALVEILPDSTPFEKYTALGAAGGMAAGALYARYRALVFYRRARYKRQWAAHAEDPDNIPEPSRFHSQAASIKRDYLDAE